MGEVSLAALFSLVFLLGLTHCQIKVLQPTELAESFDNRMIEGSTAAYGTPYYGERLTGRLVYGASKGDQWCKDSDYKVPKAIDAMALPNIIVVRRGHCNFVTKTRVAERFKSAAAVIVVDHEGSARTSADIQRVIMADDGWGGDIKIPSILITDQEGSKIIEQIQKNETDVIVELAWDIPKDGVVSLDFWMTPASEKSTTFLKEYAPYAEALQHKLDFRPHYWIFSLPRDYKDLCLDDNAVYCAFDPDIQGQVTGRDVVQESVRQMCLWEKTAKSESSRPASGRYSAVWWEYIQKQPTACPMKGADETTRLSRACSFRLMEQLNVDMEEMHACLEHDTDTILERERLNHAWSPLAMRVNDWRYSGPLDVEIVTRAVCAAFETRPQECDQLLHPSKIELETQLKRLEQEQGVPKWIVAVSVIAALFVVVLFFVGYRIWVVRHLRKSLRYEVMNEVKQQMASTSNIHLEDDAATIDTDTPSRNHSAGKM